MRKHRLRPRQCLPRLKSDWFKRLLVDSAPVFQHIKSGWRLFPFELPRNWDVDVRIGAIMFELVRTR